jgi:hypothetical protein
MARAREWLQPLRCLHLALVVAVTLTLVNLNTSRRPRRALISDAAQQGSSAPLLEPQQVPALQQLEPASSATEQRVRQLSMLAGFRHRLDASHWLSLQQPRSAAADPVPDHCQSAFGAGYLRRWNQSQFDVCSPAAAQPERQRSSIHCYTDAQSPGREKPGGLQTLCRSANLLLDSAAFSGGGGAAAAGSHHGGDHATVQAPGAPGSVRAACSADTSAYAANLAAPSSAPWFLTSLQARGAPGLPARVPVSLPACLLARLPSRACSAARSMRSAPTLPPSCPQAGPGVGPEVAAACSDPSRSVQHPVLFLMRSDSGSMFHAWEDGPTLLAALALMPDVQRAISARGLEVGGRSAPPGQPGC